MNFQTIILMAPQGEGGGGPPYMLIMFGLIFIVMYFFMIRPQSKKAKVQRTFLEEIKKGDRIVTIGGVHGRIIELNDTNMLLEIDSNTKMRIERSAISMDLTMTNYGKKDEKLPEKEKAKS